jgi:tRNA dimethylallyltransferase
MYLRGLLKGLVRRRRADDALRARLRDRSPVRRTRAPPALAGLDPESAAVVRRDAQRIVRALELALLDGETWSARLAREGRGRARGALSGVKFGLDLDASAWRPARGPRRRVLRRVSPAR